MFDNFEKHIDVMVKLGMNANQYLFCILLYNEERMDGKFIKSGKGLSNIYKYSSRYDKTGVRWGKDDIAKLIELGYIRNTHPQNKLEPDYMEIEPLFESKVFGVISKFEQLWQTYPDTVVRNGNRFILKSCDKNELEEIYNRSVPTKALQENIIHLVEWAKQNDELNISIEKFVKGQFWQTLNQIKNESSTNMTMG